MLYVLGGAMRSGKSLIARKFVSEKQIPYLPADVLVTGAQEGVPILGVQQGDEFINKAEKLWPILKPILLHIARVEPRYLVEGDPILPKHIAEIQKENQDVRACFIGYNKISAEEELKRLRQFSNVENLDWTKRISDEKMLEYITMAIEFSKYLEEECKKYNIAYFDNSLDFMKTTDDAFKYLTNQ